MAGRKNYIYTRVVPSYISAAETAGGLFNFLKLVGTILNLYIFVPKEKLHILYNYLVFRHGTNVDYRSIVYDYLSLQYSRICADTDVSRELKAMDTEIYNHFLSIEAMMENNDYPLPDMTGQNKMKPESSMSVKPIDPPSNSKVDAILKDIDDLNDTFKKLNKKREEISMTASASRQ